MDFHSMSIGSSPLCPIYDFVAKLVKASDCNSEGVSSTLTEIFLCGKPDVEGFCCGAHTVLSLVVHHYPTAIYSYNQFGD